jgi:ketosteroid isomerase-like protein
MMMRQAGRLEVLIAAWLGFGAFAAAAPAPVTTPAQTAVAQRPAPTPAQVPAPVGQPSASQQIVETERAFAQAVAQSGIAAGFRQFAAPGAVMFLPDPVPAGPVLERAQWPGELFWRPQFVAVAGSGDLAFAAGPSLAKAAGKTSGGFYLTIWKRGPDGAWKFVLDHGVDMPPAVFAAPPQPVTTLNAEPPAGQASTEGMREADGALDEALPKGAGAAFAARLDDQAILARMNRPVAVGKKRALALAEDSPPILEAQTLGGALSADGAFGYMYGRARWFAKGGAQPGYYVRVWRSTPQGWRLLADHLAER